MTENNVLELIKKAEELTKQNQFLEASRVYKKIIKHDPNQPIHIYVNLGNALINSDNGQEAEAIFKYLKKTYPNQIHGYDGLARISMRSENWESAVLRWNELLQHFPDYFWALFGKGNALLNLDKTSEAEAIFNNLKDNYPEKIQGYEGLAKVAMFSENWHLAIEQWQQILEKFPQSIDSYIGMGNALINLEKFAKAEALFEQLIKYEPDKIQGYLGLINVAKKLRNWELALERVNFALNKFPKNIILWINKIQILLQLLDFEKAIDLIKKGKEIFGNDPRFILEESNFYKLQFNYTEAEKILEKTITLGKTNFAIELQLARNYMLTGKLEKARAVFENLQNSPQAKVNPVYMNLYVQILIMQKDYLTLKQYVKDNINNTKFCTQILYDYVKFLINQKLYQQAYESIDEVINKKIDDPKKYKIQIKLVLLKQQIKYIQDLENIQNYQELKANLAVNNRINQSLKTYFQQHPQHPEINRYLIEISDDLEELYKYNQDKFFVNTFLSLYDAYEIATKIIHHIQNKKPLSLIRLGDGEGNFLEYEDELKAYQEEDQKRIQLVWWGEVSIKQENRLKLCSQYYTAINNADILGIVDLERWCRDWLININSNVNNFRGLIAVNNYLKSRILDNSLDQYFLTSNMLHIHFEQWGLYQVIFSYLKECSVISCHANISSILEEKYGIRVNKIYNIPSEYVWSHQFQYNQQYEQHYPHYFEKLCSEISVSFPGEVFLVGAGFLGKIYCDLIKQRGGIGLDFGSIFDYWLSYTTRVSHKNLLFKNNNTLLKKIINTDSRIGVNYNQDKDGKIINLPLYQSSYYCDLNIYQPTLLFNHWNLAQYKLFLITGHSRCGSQFITYLFKQFGFDIGHENLAEDGVCSWLMAVQDLNAPCGDKNNSYYTNFDYLIHYIRSPKDAIPSIILEQEQQEIVFNFRRNHILRELNFDINQYEKSIEKAIASFLAWNKIVELKVPNLVLKVEDCLNDLTKFLETKSLLRKDKSEISQIIINDKVNNSLNKFKQEKPQLTAEDYQDIDPKLKAGLINFCKGYNYDYDFMLLSPLQK